MVNPGRDRRLELTLVQGDIREVDSNCYVVGLFKAVAPDGAASALDRAMGGRISDLVARRMFGAEVGEVSILPNGRRAMRSSNIAFAGLGSFDSFTADTLKLVCENVVRMFVAAGLDEFAMVPFGWASSSDVDGEAMSAMVRSMLAGFLRGIEDSDPDHRFRSVTICERDPKRFAILNSEIHDLSQRESFANVELTIRFVRLPERPAERAIPSAARSIDRIYLMAREAGEREGGDDARPALMMSLLTTGDKAAILAGEQPGAPADVEKLLAQLGRYSSLAEAKAIEFGDELAKVLLCDAVAEGLARYRNRHLVVVHDAGASRIPWETLRIGDTFPALEGGVSHRYEASNLSVAKWLQRRTQADLLDVLLIANPTGDLPGATREGDRISKLLKGLSRDVKLKELWGEDAQREIVLEHFSSGKFDVVHYAGHAFFDPQQRARSGVFCAGHEVLSGLDLAAAGNLPTLMFFNACEAARVRGADAATDSPGPSPEGVQRGVGFAEALLRGGIANFIGTYWPVGDDAAETFATSFYPELLKGATLNDALLASRRAVKNLKAAETPQDWADYVFYGDPDFRLKTIEDPTQAGGSNDQ